MNHKELWGKILTGHESWQSLVDRICRPASLMSPSRFFA
jgi:hypothetical protein